MLVSDNVHPSAVEILRQAGDLVDVTAPGQMDRSEVIAHIGEADALIVRSATRVDAGLIEAATRLKVIGRAGVGVDNVDLDAANRRGIVVMNTPDGNTIATAEYTFGLMLSLLRHIPAGHTSLAAGKWDRKAFVGMELRGKTLGIIGLGRIGRAVARRARAFEMRVIAYDAHDSAWELARAEAIGAEMAGLDELLRYADIISLHPMLNDTTRDMINRETLAMMKPGVFVINAARGALVVEQALADALKSGHVAGAALDVYREEPPQPGNPLIGLPNVIHTPHLAASTEDAQINVAVDIARQVVDALLHGDFRNVVNPQVLAK